MNHIDEYKMLFSLSYKDLVDYLIGKYGKAEVNYYNEQSYNNFLNNDNSSPKINKRLSRTNEGLYCHHIKEDECTNLSDPKKLSKDNIPYSTQLKENLVYCNLVEHAILHTLIMSQSDNISSEHVEIINNVKKWYIDLEPPKIEYDQQRYLINCYRASFLNHDEALIIYNEMLSIIEGKQIN